MDSSSHSYSCGKLVVFSAPSGSGKSTIIRQLIHQGLPLEFSVSVTSRPPRTGEIDGKDYFFVRESEFREYISSGRFIEHEEVYPGTFYGTLKSEVDRRLSEGKFVVLDIDVQGALNVKRLYGEEALTIFIQPPSLQILEDRLTLRGTDSQDVIKTRIAKAEQEMSYAKDFDICVVNDSLERVCSEIRSHLIRFLSL